VISGSSGGRRDLGSSEPAAAATVPAAVLADRRMPGDFMREILTSAAKYVDAALHASKTLYGSL